MRVCIVDDHEIVLAGLRVALPDHAGITIVGEATSGTEALRVARRCVPDVVVTDYRLPDMTGDELCRRLRKAFPSLAVVMLTTYLSEDVVQRALDAGASGFVTKAAGLEELRGVLNDAARRDTTRLVGGAPAIVHRLHTRLVSTVARPRLTPQQERVLELAAEGLTYPEISRRLHVSESTVRFHIQRLKEKLEVRTKAELVAVAVRAALIAPGQDLPATTAGSGSAG